MEEKVTSAGKRHRIAVAWAQDTNTSAAINKAVKNGFIEAILIGNKHRDNQNMQSARY